jgi:A/G-specific adenine glycosylase
MLQQTRVAAVLPYYEAFLQRFSTIEALADASEQDLLGAWAGLGYYSRARNLQKAACIIVGQGPFPDNYAGLRALPGFGDYTASAVASIAFGLAYAAVDGNVRRVLSRVTADAGDVTSSADKLLDRRRPGDFNQAMMELGATICLPRNPQCLVCPVASQCKARALGRQQDFPIRPKKAAATQIEVRLLFIECGGSMLLWQRPPESRRMAGFWELPQSQQIPDARVERIIGKFQHTIVNTKYRFEVAHASIDKTAPGFAWVNRQDLLKIALSTTAKKAFACSSKQGQGD